MPDKDYCDITVVLDRSGSMVPVKADMEGGFQTFIQELRSTPGKCLLTLTQFDTSYEVVYSGRDLSEVPPLVLEPRGSTALFDAIGRTISMMGERFRNMAEKSRPGRVILMIMTDGYENASVEFSRQRVFDMITHQRERYQWDVIFLGTNQDAIATGLTLGTPVHANLTYANTTKGIRNTYSVAGMEVNSVRTGAKAFMSFTNDDRKKAMDVEEEKK